MAIKKANLPPEIVDQSINLLNQAMKMICNVGDHTEEDRRTNSRYVSIIIDVSTLIRGLKCLR